MPAKLLPQVLRQSEDVKELLKECAKELFCANSAIKQELATRDPLPAVASALEQSGAVQTKLLNATEQLKAMIQTLEDESRGRTMVDHQLDAALEQEAGARHTAFHDILTGLPNRALFNDRLEHAIAQATRHHWILAVVFVDLDKFKDINDTYGHAASDAVLQTVAMRLTDKTRDEDTVSRHGGDEFLCC